MSKHQHTITIRPEGIADVTITGDGDANDAQQFVADAEMAFQQDGDRTVDAIVDMAASGYSDYAGIKIYQTFLADRRLNRIAFIITDKVVEALVRIAIAPKGERAKIFSTRAAAEDWLKPPSR